MYIRRNICSKSLRRQAGYLIMTTMDKLVLVGKGGVAGAIAGIALFAALSLFFPLLVAVAEPAGTVVGGAIGIAAGIRAT